MQSNLLRACLCLVLGPRSTGQGAAAWLPCTLPRGFRADVQGFPSSHLLTFRLTLYWMSPPTSASGLKHQLLVAPTFRNPICWPDRSPSVTLQSPTGRLNGRPVRPAKVSWNTVHSAYWISPSQNIKPLKEKQKSVATSAFPKISLPPPILPYLPNPAEEARVRKNNENRL